MCVDDWPIGKMLHIDLDAFYVSVEQHDRPAFKGNSVIVVGDPLFDYSIGGHTEYKLKECLDFLDKIDLKTVTWSPIDAPKITTLTVKPKEPHS